MNYKLILLLFLLSACDLEIIDSNQDYGDYVLDANIQIKSNTNFPIESALVKMDWRVQSYFDYFENEWHYYISERDSGYTDSSGGINLNSHMNVTYYQTKIIRRFLSMCHAQVFEVIQLLLTANNLMQACGTLPIMYIDKIFHTQFI